MFAVEIQFPDNNSEREMIYVRRSHALIGGTDAAHVVIDDLVNLGYQLELVRDLGRTFRCNYIPLRGDIQYPEGATYNHTAKITLGKLILHIVSLDSDLLFRPGETPDKAGTRIMRTALSRPTPVYPAVRKNQPPHTSISFDPKTPVLIGKGKECLIRIDAPAISPQHARLGFEDNSFWIEDLGSAKGTFVKNQQVSGKIKVPAGEPIFFGTEVSIVGIAGEQESAGALPSSQVTSETAERYPLLLALTDVARPARLVLAEQRVMTIGRDPTSDIWLGAPHISRMHCQVELTDDGLAIVTDTSTNGMMVDGVLTEKGKTVTLSKLGILDFGAGISLAVCFSFEDEEQAIEKDEEMAKSSGSHQVPNRQQGDRATSNNIFDDLEADIEADEPESQIAGFFQNMMNKGIKGKLLMIFLIVAVLVIGIAGGVLVVQLL